jgi:uncharacterized protein YkwD
LNGPAVGNILGTDEPRPNLSNMGRPSFYRLVTILAITSVAASCVAPRSTPLPSARPAEPADFADFSDQLVKAHNVRRAKAGLPPLFPNALLDAAATGHARDMAERRKMSHRGGDGSSPFDRIDRQGYRYRAAGENVAYGFDDVESVMLGWMKSPGHRRNILGKYSEIGVGRAIAKDGSAYWSVTFGTPLDR